MSAGDDNWSKVKKRLQAEVGDDIYSSWFARMDLEAIEDGTVRLSVPTRFLKSWIQSHYAERVLACWQAEATEVGRIELIVRSAMRAEHGQAEAGTRAGRQRQWPLHQRPRRQEPAADGGRGRMCTRRWAARRSIRA